MWVDHLQNIGLTLDTRDFFKFNFKFDRKVPFSSRDRHFKSAFLECVFESVFFCLLFYCFYSEIPNFIQNKEQVLFTGGTDITVMTGHCTCASFWWRKYNGVLWLAYRVRGRGLAPAQLTNINLHNMFWPSKRPDVFKNVRNLRVNCRFWCSVCSNYKNTRTHRMRNKFW